MSHPALAPLGAANVLAAAQNGGWGGRLFDAALQRLERDGPRTLWIGVWSENFGAQRFYARAGFDTFDMADHYGSAEIITGHLLKRFPAGSAKPRAFTKWCPEPGPMTRDIVRRGVEDRLQRLGVPRDIVNRLQGVSAARGSAGADSAGT